MNGLLRIAVGVVAVVVVVMLNTVFVMWLERKFLGHLQSRRGPMRTGYHGLLQPFADALKMLGKEDLVPAAADRALFLVAPLIAFSPAVLIHVAMPWTEWFAKTASEIGLLMLFAVAALSPVGVVVAGWASHNKYSLIGGIRAAAQQVSYEVPLLLSVVGVVMLARSMRLTDVVGAQGVAWNIVWQPLGFLIFFIGMLAELNRVPFDLPEAESELVSGFNTEYSSMRFALFFLAEYMNVFTWSLVGALVFLGGWMGPVLPGVVWLALKTYALVLLIIWVRGTVPRVRVDQLLAVSWKVLLPASLLGAMITAVGVVFGPIVLVPLQFAGVLTLGWVIARLGNDAGEAARAVVRL